MIRIPYNFLPPKVLRRFAKAFIGLGQAVKPVFPLLDLNLKQSGMDVDAKEYIALCISSTLFFFVILGFILTFVFSTPTVISLIGFEAPLGVGFIVSAVFSLFVFAQQIMYPRIYSNRKIRGLEKNLLPALQNILIQLNSGVPLFNILVNISKGDYGDLSKEFSKAVKQINTGRPQVEALEELASENPSPLFRRAVWQIVNSMKAGSDLATVINDIINDLSEEQLVQIQNYGSQLNPLAMFYMLVAVIAPSLSITFIIIISSFIALSENATKMALWGLLVFIIFLQIIFLGMIKSRRPHLLSE
ncbi:MAG: type II secretion system F family protein [Candidatus Nanoarchaeia archaeon]